MNSRRPKRSQFGGILSDRKILRDIDPTSSATLFKDYDIVFALREVFIVSHHGEAHRPQSVRNDFPAA